MTATAVKTHVVAREERASAKAVFDLLARADPLDVVKLVSEPLRGPATSVPISKSLVAAIRDLSGLIQSGEKVGIFADDPEVSPEQASDMLGLSRPHHRAAHQARRLES